MKLYLAGPMTGYDDYNFPAFHNAAAGLRASGHEVVSPAEMDEGIPPEEHEALDWSDYLRRDLELLVGCEGVAVLPGWQDSKGASLEVHVANALGMPIIDAQLQEPVEPNYGDSILAEAERLVNGPRGDDYGHPIHDFRRTAGMVTALIKHKLRPGERVTAKDWSMFMVLAKLSREMNRPKRDNRVDVAGYILTGDMIENFERGEAEVLEAIFGE